MRGSAGGLEKLSAGVSGLVKKTLDCTVCYTIRLNVHPSVRPPVRPSVFFKLDIIVDIGKECLGIADG